MGLEPENELTLTGQHKYGSGAGSGSRVDPPYGLRSDIDGTGARDGVDPQKVQHKYGFGAGSTSAVNSPQIDLTLVPIW